MTTPKEFYRHVQEKLFPLIRPEGWTEASLSPGPIRISVNRHDIPAIKLLLWLCEKGASANDLHAVLEAALWWVTFYASFVAPPEDKPDEEQAP